jgi:FeS cluster assembly scaffold protein NifU
MKSTEYTEKVLDHFKNPRNVGTLEGPDVAVGRVGNPICGDLMEIYIKVDDDKIDDIKFKTFGCGSAVATSSMITEMVRGKTLDEAMKVTRKNVADELEGLPPIKMHCSNLAADALHEAIKNYRQERGIATEDNVKSESVLIDGDQPIIGEKEYFGKGLYYQIDDFKQFENKRVLIVYKNNKSVEDALELTKHTGRVVLTTRFKEIGGDEALIKRLLRSDVKIITQSALLEILGEGEVEKVKMHNLDEDEKYELYVDAIILPPKQCE